MKLYEYGNPDAGIVLIQPVDDHDMQIIENQVKLITDGTGREFCLKAFKVGDWNRDLSPWQAPPVFGKEAFGGEAETTLAETLKCCEDESKTYIIGGYSLAGLFALWASFKTDRFSAIAAASPSVWFPGFTDFMAESGNTCSAKAVYLSLGDKEGKTKNPAMARVGECIEKARDILETRGISTALEWNPGNHFRDPDIRTAKAFAWTLNTLFPAKKC